MAVTQVVPSSVGKIMLISQQPGSRCNEGQDRDLLCCRFSSSESPLHRCAGGLFSELGGIGAESELEYRKLHPRADNSEETYRKMKKRLKYRF